MKRILALDIGGTGLKAAVIDPRGHFLTERVRIPTPHPCPPKLMVAALTGLAAPLKPFDCATIGFPGYVRAGTVFTAPNLGTEEWAGFALEKAMAKSLRVPVRLMNDADVQGGAAIKGRGLELVVTLGTGFGTAWFLDGVLLPHLEFAHVPMHHGHDFDAYIGEAARKSLGHKKWEKRVHKSFEILKTVFNYDRLYIGGGNAQRLKHKLPAHAAIVPNDDGMAGAAYAWRAKPSAPSRPAKPSRPKSKRRPRA